MTSRFLLLTGDKQTRRRPPLRSTMHSRGLRSFLGCAQTALPIEAAHETNRPIPKANALNWARDRMLVADAPFTYFDDDDVDVPIL